MSVLCVAWNKMNWALYVFNDRLHLLPHASCCPILIWSSWDDAWKVFLIKPRDLSTDLGSMPAAPNPLSSNIFQPIFFHRQDQWTDICPHLQLVCLPGGPQKSKTQVENLIQILTLAGTTMGHSWLRTDLPHSTPEFYSSSYQLPTQARSAGRYPLIIDSLLAS